MFKVTFNPSNPISLYGWSKGDFWRDITPSQIHPMDQAVITNNIVVILEPTIKPFMFDYKRTSLRFVNTCSFVPEEDQISCQYK